MAGNCVIVMAKWPEAGNSKTRLAPGLGAEGASLLSAAFLADTVAMVAALSDVTPLIAFAPSTRHDKFARIAGSPCILYAQPEGDLGDRLSAAFTAAFAAGFARACAIAIDSPTLPPAYISRAFRELRRRRTVIGPAIDGGYYLVGMSRLVPGLFTGIDWSTERVFGETLARCRALRLRPAILEPWYDVDEPEALERLYQDATAAEATCPHTRAVLESLLGSVSVPA